MLPNHYAAKAQPSKWKKTPNYTMLHVAPPLKGLSLATRFQVADPQQALVLINYTVNDDRLTIRAGFQKRSTRGTAPIWQLVPYYGPVAALAAASNHELWNAQNGNLIKGGFTSDDWHWTAFSNLGQQVYTVMVNGSDGVWSWNGDLTQDTSAGPVAVTNLSKANPAVCTVGGADIGKFANGQQVLIAGAVGTGLVNANGYHTIASVNSPANTFVLTSVDTSTATGPQTSGVTADPIVGGIVKEVVTTDPADTFINVNAFNIVVSHMNRLFFADSSNLAVYYLPLQQKSGQVSYLPLNAIFKRGGYIKAMYTWTIGGATNMFNQLVIFTSNGECAIYQGTDPDTDFSLAGVYRFDPPMSKHSVANYGGELYVLINTGLVPMSTLMKAETDHLGENERNLVSAFLLDAIRYQTFPGWSTFLNPSTGRLFCNLPQGSPNTYKQYVRHMPKELWSQFQGLPARCFGWIDPYVYFGDDFGNVYAFHPSYQNDDGLPIFTDVMMGWSQFKSLNKKKFNAIRSYVLTDGAPQPTLDVKADYDQSPGINVPDITQMPSGAIWDVSAWDTSYWAAGVTAQTNWNGIAVEGVVGAIRMTARVNNCSWSITGWDIYFEQGMAGP